MEHPLLRQNIITSLHETLKTSIPPHTGGANHIRITAAKIQKNLKINDEFLGCEKTGWLKLKVQRQVTVPIVYKGVTLKSELRADLIVEDQVIVEIKSVEEMKKVFSKQLLSYLRLTHKKLGLLVNFNTPDILKSIYRIIN